jgi:hypothetical protein
MGNYSTSVRRFQEKTALHKSMNVHAAINIIGKRKYGQSRFFDFG